MRDAMKLGFSLCIYALVAALALALTNAVTKGPIEEQQLAASQAAQRAVLEEATRFAPLDIQEDDAYSELTGVFEGTRDGETVGYVFTASPRGYGGEVPITLGVGVDGSVHGITVGDLLETAGLGTRVAEEPFLSQYYGIAVDPDTIDNDVDTISGVTVTSAPFKNATVQMFAYSKNVLGVEPNYVPWPEVEKEPLPEGVYEVDGFGGAMQIKIDMDDAGIIQAVDVLSHNETDNFGTKVLNDKAVLDALVGQDITTAQIDTISGATITSNAVNKLLRMAAGIEETPVVEEPTADAANVYEAKGFAGAIQLKIDVDDAGIIQAIEVLSHNETAGFGKDLLESDEVLGSLVGQGIATAQIDTVSGVTYTSDAINDALKQAAEAVGGEAAPVVEEPTADAANVYEAKGFAGAIQLKIDVDDAGIIQSIEVLSHSETAGFGKDLLESDEVLGSLVGQDIAAAQIDTVGGVTYTSDAINDALKQAAEAIGGEAAPVVEEPTADVANVYEAKGFAGAMQLKIDVDDAGIIQSIEVLSHSETEGFGKDLLEDDEVLGSLVGQDIATAQIDTVSGVTYTSDAINDALKQAAEAVVGEAAPMVEEPTADAANVYEAKGFAGAMQLKIDVDDAGIIQAIEVLSHSETAGFGKDLLESDEVLGSLVGQDIATAQIDTVSGVTYTSDAINDALKQAAAAQGTDATANEAEQIAAESVAGIEGTYTVKGYSLEPFDVTIALDEEGNITSIRVGENKETPSVGGKVLSSAGIFDALIGQNIENAQLDVVTNATITSQAINDALKQAAEAFKESKGAEQ